MHENDNYVIDMSPQFVDQICQSHDLFKFRSTNVAQAIIEIKKIGHMVLTILLLVFSLFCFPR